MFQQLILASASPRRREILAQAGIPFTVQVAKIENIDFSEHYVKALALGKASAVLAENVDIFRIVVLGADTVVVHRGEILNKPVDLADARGMLLRLQGDVHTVYTGVALCYRREDSDNSLIFSNFAVRTEVVFYPMNQEEIEEYLNCGEYMDSLCNPGKDGSLYQRDSRGLLQCGRASPVGNCAGIKKIARKCINILYNV